MADTVTSVMVHQVPGDVVPQPTDRPCLVLDCVIDDDPNDPTVSYTVSTNMSLPPGLEQATHVLGVLMHDCAHALLARDAALLDLSPATPEANG